MSLADCMFPPLVCAFVLMAFVGGCDRLRLSMLENDKRHLQRRINDLELRIYRVELKIKETRNET